MPSGRVHTMTTIGLAVGSIPLSNPHLTVGILSGLILSPDLDVDDGFIGLAHLRRVPFVGTPLAWMWRAFWWLKDRPASLRHISRADCWHYATAGLFVRPFVGYEYDGCSNDTANRSGVVAYRIVRQ